MGWGGNSVVVHLPNMHEALSLKKKSVQEGVHRLDARNMPFYIRTCALLDFALCRSSRTSASWIPRDNY
jgi:hypothetical protein